MPSRQQKAAALAALAAAGAAHAQFAPAWTWNRHSVNVWTTGAITTTRGYEFTVSQPVTVDALGVFDDELHFDQPAIAHSFPGLAQAHPMALWNLADTTRPI